MGTPKVASEKKLRGALALGIVMMVGWVLFPVSQLAFLLLHQLPFSAVSSLLWIVVGLSTPIMVIGLLLFAIIHRGAAWRHAALPAVGVLLVATVSLAVCSSAGCLSESMRLTAFHRVARNSTSLIRAIERYQHDHHGTPPEKLDQLVPQYLSVLPHTGLWAFPDYQYLTNSNKWFLTVPCPLLVMDFSYYTYQSPPPSPGHEPGETVARIGNWFYSRD